MKKIISSTVFLLLCTILLIFIFLVSIIGLAQAIFGLPEEKFDGLVGFVVWGSLFTFLLLLTNRLVHIISFENGVIKRKGLIGGFYKECPIASIQKVVTKHVWREGDYIFLVDDSAHKYDSAQRDSYISFRKTRKNLKFLQTFWSGDIEKC